MPLYEYTCDNCKKRYTVLVGMTAAADKDTCPNCGYNQATKRVTRFARLRSEDEMLDSMADMDKLGDIENDPKAMRRWAKELGKEMGEDLGDDFEEYMDAAESGEDMDGEGGGPMPPGMDAMGGMPGMGMPGMGGMGMPPGMGDEE